MIITVTLNAALDRTLLVPNFLVARRHRASDGITLAGGRGVTVARALKRLGYPVVAVGLAGGVTGENIVERLVDEGILNDFVRIREPSRTSTAVVDPISGTHTEINEYGPRVNRDEIDELFARIQHLAKASRCVILAGTLPREVEPDTYSRIIRRLNANNIMTVVTAPDDAQTLAAALTAEPTVALAEQREAEAVVGHEFTTSEDFVDALDTLARMGARSVLIRHEGGCYARTRVGRQISYHEAVHPEVEVVSTIGSSDVFLAGYIAAVCDERPTADALRSATAAGLANARTLGAGVFEPGDVQRMAQHVDVSELQPASTA